MCRGLVSADFTFADIKGLAPVNGPHTLTCIKRWDGRKLIPKDSLTHPPPTTRSPTQTHSLNHTRPAPSTTPSPLPHSSIPTLLILHSIVPHFLYNDRHASYPGVFFTMLFLNRRYTDGVTLPRKGLDAILGTSQSLLKEEAQVGITRQIAITHKVDKTFTV